MIQFTFKYMCDEFDIRIKNKYTVLSGDSGTGRSLLIKRADQFAQEPRYGECSEGFSIDAMTAIRWESTLKSNAKVIVVNEDFLLDNADDNMLSLISLADKYFVIVGRSAVAGILFGDYSIFEFEALSEHHRRMIPARM